MAIAITNSTTSSVPISCHRGFFLALTRIARMIRKTAGMNAQVNSSGRKYQDKRMTTINMIVMLAIGVFWLSSMGFIYCPAIILSVLISYRQIA
jgi:hypothetical protein